MSTESDPQPQDLGAIEAAVRETARGRAFLANYARRVQQSDTLTMLATLGRLERLSVELASRMAELEAGAPGLRHPAPVQAASPDPEFAPASTAHPSPDPMQRIDELASTLDNLHRHAVQLMAQCDGVEAPSPRSSDAKTQEHGDEELLGMIAQALER